VTSQGGTGTKRRAVVKDMEGRNREQALPVAGTAVTPTAGAPERHWNSREVRRESQDDYRIVKTKKTHFQGRSQRLLTKGMLRT